MSEQIRRSSGNVFRDLGASEAEAENLRVRSVMMMQLESLIRKEGWTQREAARVLGVTQPRVSDLMRGKIGRFSVDSLIELYGRCGLAVTFSAKRKRRRVA
jgi:predicted XRE-type DNA-binding protein